MLIALVLSRLKGKIAVVLVSRVEFLVWNNPALVPLEIPNVDISERDLRLRHIISGSRN